MDAAGGVHDGGVVDCGAVGGHGAEAGDVGPWLVDLAGGAEAAEAGGGHAEGREEAVADEGFPWFAGKLLEHGCDYDVVCVCVMVGAGFEGGSGEGDAGGIEALGCK